MRVADNLDAAADVLLRDGWTRGLYVAADKRRCVLGAIALVKGINVAAGDGGFRISRSPEAAALDRFLPGISVPHWNDNMCQDAGEAQDALRRCAKALREVGT